MQGARFKQGGTKADHTAISFKVDAIDPAIKTLKKAGVVFEDYDFPGTRLRPLLNRDWYSRAGHNAFVCRR